MGKQIVHLIVGLGKGGAETMLYNTLYFRSKTDVKYKVITLGQGSYFSKKIKVLGVEVVELGLKKRPIRSIFSLLTHCKDIDVLCCWMYHANFIGFFVGKLMRCKKIIWNIRHSNLDPRYNKKTTLLLNNICSRLSNYIQVITYNGEKAKQVHESVGYSKNKSVVLQNGCDVQKYKKIEGAREELNREFDELKDEIVILSAAKDHPIKDIPNFIDALAILKDKGIKVVGIMCGQGIDDSNRVIVEYLEEKRLILDRDVYLLGLRDDLNKLMSGCDLYVLHSAGEAFPNTLIEAMACEANVVATDVGDVSKIINNNIVTARDSEKLAEVIIKNLYFNNKEKQQIGKNNRKIVVENYSMSNRVKDYEKIIAG